MKKTKLVETNFFNY